MPISHPFVSAVADGSTTADVRPIDWNNAHISTISNSSLVFPELLSRTVSTAGTSNSSAVSTLINYVIPARLMSSNRILRWTMGAEIIIGTTGAANNYRLEVIHNTSRWADFNSTQAAVDTLRSIRMEVNIAALNSSATRKMWGHVYESSGVNATFGEGALNVTAAVNLTRHYTLFGSSDTYTVTTGADSTFVVQFNWVAANSSLSFRMRYNNLELI